MPDQVKTRMFLVGFVTCILMSTPIHGFADERDEAQHQIKDASQQHALGRMFEYGLGRDRDDVKAAEWYTKAAAQDFPDALYRLGVLHENGWGVPRDVALAAHLYARAARYGHAFAQHDLAFMYMSGTGVPKDHVQAYKWLKIAAMTRADLMTKHLSHIAGQMTSIQIEEAEHLARLWFTERDI